MIRIPKTISILTILLIFPSLAIAQQFKVIRVPDNDTIKVESQGNTVYIRLVGIDAPETSKKKGEAGQPFSQKSKKYLTSLVLNKIVEIKDYGTDRYGRTLGVVYVDGVNVNLEMVKAGLAEVYRGRNVKGLDLELFWKTEEDARVAKRGMWVLGDKYVSPREWRKMH
jgi:endonuclease YncB( thermonuclease family)